MSILKRLMLSILMFCTLGYGSAWAFDEHVVSETFHTVDQQLGSAAEHDSTAEHVADHCGHALAHIVGLFNHITFSFSVSTLRIHSDPLQDFSSFVPLLYLRPPSV